MPSQDAKPFIHDAYLLNNILAVVISERPAEFIVVHPLLMFSMPPLLGHFFTILQFELSVQFIRPLDESSVRFVHQQLQEELPQVHGSARDYGKRKAMKLLLKLFYSGLCHKYLTSTLLLNTRFFKRITIFYKKR